MGSPVQSVQHELYGVVGRPARHSLSPAMMQAGFRALQVNALYLALEAETLQEALSTLELLGFRGLSVTVPFKQEAFGLCARVDAAAQSIGAVNSLRRMGSGWEGRNTDWLGAVRALERFGPLRGVPVLVLGAGGAARGVVYGLVHCGAKVIIANRTESRAQELAAVFGCDWAPLSALGDISPKIVVHTTSGGMSGRPYAFHLPPRFFTPDMVVMDIVYAPLETPLLTQAKQAGAQGVCGLEMLLYQGVEQFVWWLNRPAPERAMREALWKAARRAQRKVGS